MLLTILRTSQQALFTFHDTYLLTNCTAILLNLSSYICNIHSYAAERIVAVVLKLCTRYIKLRENSTNLDLAPNGNRYMLLIICVSCVTAYIRVASGKAPCMSQSELLSSMEEYLRVLLILVGVMLRFELHLLFIFYN